VPGNPWISCSGVCKFHPLKPIFFLLVEEAEEHHHWSKEGIRGRKDFRKDRAKDRGYRMFEEEDSEEELMVGEAR
jgi:hypothetical protein